jgi:putative sterol carrier protein
MVAGLAPEGRWTSVSGRAPGLAGLSCHVELYVANALAGVLRIEESGDVCIVDQGGATALIAMDSQETLVQLLRGDLPPIVAHLQGLVRFEGDADLALRVLFGLQEGSPWIEPETGERS